MSLVKALTINMVCFRILTLMEFIVCNFFIIFVQNILIKGFPLVSNNCSSCEGFYGTSKLTYRRLVFYCINPNKAHDTEFILSDNCSTCFGRDYHPSSGAQTTVTTASGDRYTVLLSAAIVEELELI
jgi:hypothetical protein